MVIDGMNNYGDDYAITCFASQMKVDKVIQFFGILLHAKKAIQTSDSKYAVHSICLLQNQQKDVTTKVFHKIL
ncbi:hypothetical protein BCR32DRAFT_286552 [Anaeromyces robustus]|uniref:Uncharacterized protein n=1 Tax=Anaeromyces robustus TaxID=1754192 RepID=A0A1Y1VWF3_9FUNG|nr:hypothetical protein BCR32DRAFT_286552 [Anaeromyces robustus]|eukprot:ORX65355.1 hypothetical protein BCR32DRAFT_286552 [Anaeromyces robustus]